MRTPEETKSRIAEIEKALPITPGWLRKDLRIEMFSLKWMLGDNVNVQRKATEKPRRGLPSKIVKNQMAKQ